MGTGGCGESAIRLRPALIFEPKHQKLCLKSLKKYLQKWNRNTDFWAKTRIIQTYKTDVEKPTYLIRLHTHIHITYIIAFKITGSLLDTFLCLHWACNITFSHVSYLMIKMK